MTMTQ